MNLTGKTVVITGASRGLGAGIARSLHDQGMNLGLCARSKPVLTDQDRVHAAQVDVTDAEAVNKFAEQTAASFGRIDLWINNAGVLAPVKQFRDIRPEEFRKHIDINLMGVIHGSKAYLDHLIDTNDQGVLINISSGASWAAYSGWSAYCAGKAAVERFTECLQLEEPQLLRAYSVAPGVIDTDMQSTIRQTSADDFPALEKFLELKDEEAFNTPEFVAEHLTAIAFDKRHRPAEVALRIPAMKG